MNKLILLAGVILSFSRYAAAQVTLATNDFSHAGDTIRVSTASAFSTIDTSGGVNYTWDYSQLQFLSQSIVDFKAISQLPTYIAGYFSIFKPCNQAIFNSTSFLDTLGIPISGTYDLFYNTSADFRQRGIGIVTDTLALPVGYSTDDIVYKFPLQFGNSDSSSSGYTIDQVPGIYYRSSKQRYNTVDGWGMLVTPYGTFAVLMMRSVVHEHDSIVVDSLGVNFGIDLPEAVEYKWLGTGQKIPLLQVNTSGGLVTQVIYRDSARIAIGVPEITAENFHFEIFPNPSVKNVFVKYSLLNAAEVGFDIYNAEGQLVCSEKPEMTQAGEHIYTLKNASALSAGNYLVRMNAGGKYFSRSLIVTK
jgi:hypothetical protein